MFLIFFRVGVEDETEMQNFEAVRTVSKFMAYRAQKYVYIDNVLALDKYKCYIGLLEA